MLFTRARRLIFDLAEETVQDEDGNVSTVSVSYRGGVLYVPLGLCASHFGLSTSMLTSAGGYTVLRFTTGSQVYEDSLFIEKAENLIAYRIAQLEKKVERHNGFGERIPVLEERIKVVNHRLSDLEETVGK